MRGRNKKSQREKDLTGRYLSGGFDEDRQEQQQRFGERSRQSKDGRIHQTAALRAEQQGQIDDLDSLPIGQVIQVSGQYAEALCDGVAWLCLMRKTLSKISETSVIVGDRIRIRPTAEPLAGQLPIAAGNMKQGVIEQILPRDTVLTRSDSFKQISQHPIVANADQMLIVASLRDPDVKWGLVDRMIIAAQSGGLRPIVALNKMDLAIADPPDADLQFARAALAHYESLGVATLQTSVDGAQGIAELRNLLADKVTVLAGHSGVGKSSLIRAIQPHLELRVNPISNYTGKGRHTTTSARHYPLDFGGAVIDTPGVKLFGLWGLTRENLDRYFPDIQSDTAPPWRRESHQRISQSLRA